MSENDIGTAQLCVSYSFKVKRICINTYTKITRVFGIMRTNITHFTVYSIIHKVYIIYMCSYSYFAFQLSPIHLIEMGPYSITVFTFRRL